MSGKSRADRIRARLADGDKAEALADASAWVSDEPESAEAHNSLGTAFVAEGNRDAAEAAFRRATELDGGMSKAFSNLGATLRARGDFASAVLVLERAVALNPENPRARTNLGNVLRQLGRADEAISAHRRALELNPSASAHHALGASFVAAERFADAISVLQKGLLEGAETAATRDLLIDAWLALGRPESALAVTDARSDPAALLARARTLFVVSGVEEAETALAAVPEEAVRSGPGHALSAMLLEARGDHAGAERAATAAAESLATAAAWCEVARLRHGMGPRGLGVAEALARAEEAEPMSAAPDVFRSEMLIAGGALADAEELLERAAAKAPGAAEISGNLARIHLLRGDVTGSLEIQRTLLRRRPDHAVARANLLLSLHYEPPAPSVVFEEHLAWSGREAPAQSASFAPRAQAQGRRLRVGYLSADVRNHPVARFFEPLLRGHDRTRFEVFIYDAGAREDDTTRRLRELADRWCPTRSLADGALARRIQGDGIDVLVDLGGHTADSRVAVLARRPAPVQASFLGYPDTTGIPAVDLRITDAVADPPGLADRWVVEQLGRLPRCAWCFEPEPNAPPVARRPPDAPIVFGVFHHTPKISAEFRKAIARILERVPGSRLLFKGKSLNDPVARRRLLVELERRGVADRADLRSWTPTYDEHLASYAEIDLALDSFPYTGTTTTCEALWMGVPVVTLEGETHAARVGASLLTAVGLDALVSSDFDDFVERAVALAGDGARLEELRRTLRGRFAGSPLRDGASYAREVEAIYLDAFERWRVYAAATDGAPDAWIALSDGSVVSVPDRSDCATRFVLEEQGDWFEPELRFARALLDLGDTAVDVGANFGVYSVAMAKRVGPFGRVLSFEPAPGTAAHLRRSAARAPAVRVVQAAAGAARGKSSFDLGTMPELAQLVDAAASAVDQSSGAGRVEVDVVPLDDFLDDLSGLVFAKVDAEGAEPRVIAGATRLIAREDPIWLLELRHGSSLNHALLAALSERAPHLRLMRWVDRLGALVPFDPHGPLDRKWLNVVALSEARREQLSERHLATRGHVRLAEATGAGRAKHARATLERARSTVDPTERFDLAVDALGAARAAFREDGSVTSAFLLARAAHEAGFDGEANTVVADVLARIAKGERVALHDEMITPLPAQEASRAALDRDGAVEALALQARLQLGAWSSYYAMPQHEAWLERLASLGALTPKLVRMRDAIRRWRSRRAVRT